MSDNSVTGRDGYIVRKALGYGIASICRLPKMQQEYSDMMDMRRVLDHLCAGSTLSAEHFIDGALAHLNGDGFNNPEDPRAA